MKKLTLLTIAMASLCAMPTLVLAQDPVPPKPPGGTDAPKPPGDKPGAKPERGPGRPGGPEGGRMNPEARLKMMTEKLSLTQDQQDKIKAIQEKNGPQIRELMAKGRENLSDADKTKLRELMKGQMEEIAAVLTPEQREKMKEMRPGGPGGDRKPGERGPKPADKK